MRWARATAWLMVLGGLGGCGGAEDPADQGAGAGAGASASSAQGAGGAGGASGAGGEDPAGAGGGCFGEGGGSADGGGLTCDGPGARFVTSVLSACFGDGQDFGQDQLPEIVHGPPQGEGCCGGSLDVSSLGNGGSITLAFEGNAIADGPGPDFLVFENAFYLGGDPEQVYAELATVEVSADGARWHAFPCTATEPPYGACAGWHPVYAGPAAGDIDPLDPAAAGGDPFDLAELGLQLARFVRITDRPDMPDVFDLDAVGIVNAACP